MHWFLNIAVANRNFPNFTGNTDFLMFVFASIAVIGLLYAQKKR